MNFNQLFCCNAFDSSKTKTIELLVVFVVKLWAKGFETLQTRCIVCASLYSVRVNPIKVSVKMIAVELWHFKGKTRVVFDKKIKNKRVNNILP